MTVAEQRHLTDWCLTGTSEEELDRVVAGEHWDPHHVLGACEVDADGVSGVVVRAWHPGAASAEVVLAKGKPKKMERIHPGGIYATLIEGAQLPLHYKLRFTFADGATWERGDPYRFMPTLGETDIYLFNEGRHLRVWEQLGAHVDEIDGETGVRFAVWAPNARRVSVVADCTSWDGRHLPMRAMGSSGVWELFVPGMKHGDLYKFEIKGQDGALHTKADPYAFWSEGPPQNASRVFESRYQWSDDDWMRTREGRDWRHEPMTIYEVHFGSWKWRRGGGPLSYRELADELVPHLKRFGFTHVEPMPVAEYPFDGSWGYQVTGYYAATHRFGDPDDFRYFVDQCHQAGIGVIVDWVPGHFPKDLFALAKFDGTCCYEHADPRKGEHPDWGTLVFNYGRNEVRNFLIANALFWLEEFHVDGLRVDAVASMLYLDYSRNEGEWIPNEYGGRENLEAIHFLQETNRVIHERHPGAITVAEESTAWGGVTASPDDGGLGFTFKWNMGWMHDTLLYFAKEPVHRKFHHGDITFAMIYEYHEKFIMPLSHDEVVHGKQHLLEKLPGDLWQKFANLRLLLAYQYLRPGKILLFQGFELAPWYEWNYQWPLDWGLSQHVERAAFQRFIEALGKLYLGHSALWRRDHEPEGFEWIDYGDWESSVLSFVRRDGDERLVVALNMTPVPREGYRIGAPHGGRFVEIFNSDAPDYFGSSYPTSKFLEAELVPSHGREHSLVITLPPLACVVWKPE